jgi:hypothetical protein
MGQVESGIPEPGRTDADVADNASMAVADLARALRHEPSAAIAALPPHTLLRLAGQIDAGRRHHRAVADQAIARALKGVPLPVRGLVRKALT